jgi:hypothetical protein
VHREILEEGEERGFNAAYPSRLMLPQLDGSEPVNWFHASDAVLTARKQKIDNNYSRPKSPQEQAPAIASATCEERLIPQRSHADQRCRNGAVEEVVVDHERAGINDKCK